MVKKTVKCRKCKKKIETTVDKMGVPYTQICPECKRTYGRLGRGVATAY